METLRKINTYLARFEEWLLVVIVLFMVTLAFLQVILRNIFAENLMWGDPLLRHLVLWVGFIGASLATKENKHINIDAMSRFLKGRIKTAVQALISLIAMSASLILCSAAWDFIMMEREYGGPVFGNVPAWYFQIIIPIGFGLMSLRFFIQALEQVYLLFTKKGDGR